MTAPLQPGTARIGVGIRACVRSTLWFYDNTRGSARAYHLIARSRISTRKPSRSASGSHSKAPSRPDT